MGFLLVAPTGCAEMLGAMGTGAAVTAEYVLSGSVTKTITHEFGRIKKALMLALRRMEIPANKEREVDGGEEITASAGKLAIRIELMQITPRVTRITVTAQKGFMTWDRATAQEIISQTDKVAQSLTG